MERGEVYADAARAIRRLAEQHDATFNRYSSLLATGLQGPAAARMLEEARTQAVQVNRAFLTAWDTVAAAAGREGAAPGARPFLRSPTINIGIRGPGRRGLDPSVLSQAIREARAAGTRLCDAGRGLASFLSHAGFDPSHGHTVQAIGDWLLGRQYEVKRRLRLAEAAEAAVGGRLRRVGHRRRHPRLAP